MSDAESCPYCSGTLQPMENRKHTYQCSNVGACPATFVAVINGGAYSE